MDQLFVFFKWGLRNSKGQTERYLETCSQYNKKDMRQTVTD